MKGLYELFFFIFCLSCTSWAIKLDFSRKGIITENILDSSSGKKDDFQKLIHSVPSKYVEEIMLKISSQKLESFERCVRS